MVDEELGVEGDENGPARLVPETVLKAVLIEDGQETCHVGFLPRHIALRPTEVERLSGKFAQVLELYDDLEESKHKRTKSVRNQGMASFILMSSVVTINFHCDRLTRTFVVKFMNSQDPVELFVG